MPENYTKSDEIRWGDLPQQAFPCRPPYIALILALLLFGVGAAFMGHEAMYNTRGLIINGIIHLGPAGATNFYWLIALASGAFVVIAVLTMVSALAYGIPDVILQKDAITFPAGFPVKRPFLLPYSQITGLSLRTYNRQRTLILHTRIKDRAIALNWLRGKGAEHELIGGLQSHLAACGASQG
ncbi:hypothetical protein [Prosthecobacter sp.]|uniref:hypothetical protein n=1 Tax=Prosthecobacter sp. TaxID=1965333 RepID=UPI0037842F09